MNVSFTTKPNSPFLIFYKHASQYIAALFEIHTMFFVSYPHVFSVLKKIVGCVPDITPIVGQASCQPDNYS